MHCIALHHRFNVTFGNSVYLFLLPCAAGICLLELLSGLPHRLIVAPLYEAPDYFKVRLARLLQARARWGHSAH
jgi:hypothetical protein